MATKGQRADRAKKAYKQAKKANKKAIDKQYAKLQKNASLKDRLMYNDATRRKAAKYVVNNNMSVAEATKKANSNARKTTAALLAAYGAVKVAHKVAKAVNNHYNAQVLDAAGNVIKRFHN